MYKITINYDTKDTLLLKQIYVKTNSSYSCNYVLIHSF